MELKEQVTSLELSKKLKELGVKQESLFWWRKTNTDEDGEKYVIAHGNDWAFCDFSAFTVAELGAMLPKDFWVWKNNFEFRPSSDGFFIPKSDRISFGLRSEIKLRDKSEANARAKMLIYLIENKLIDPLTIFK